MKTLRLMLFVSLLALTGRAANYNMSNTNQTVTCGSTDNFYDPGGSGANYGSNLSYTMTISAGTAGQCVSVTFTTFTLEATYDFLYIYDGTNTSAPLLGTYTGGTSPGTVTSSSGSLTFRFYSDAFTTSAGWAATAGCTGSCATPIVVMSNTSQTLTCGTTYNFYDSGGSGSNYGNSLSYTMTVTAGTAGQCVTATFTTFTLEATYDYLYIYDGSSTAATLIGSYTGGTSPGTVTSSSGTLTFRFYSDAATTSAGWAATLSCTASCAAPSSTILMGNSSPTLSCGTTYNFYDSGGSGSNYGNSLSYTLTATAGTAGQCVTAAFTTFTCEATYDYLYIYDGSNTSAPLLGSYTGGTSPGTITSTSGTLTFRFYSDGLTTSAGWAATLTCAAACSGTPTAGTATATATALSCGTTTTALGLSGHVRACGLTYQWQSSPNNSTWTNIAGATSSTYTPTVTSNTYYRCVVSCGGTPSNSGSVYITAGPLTNDLCANATTITMTQINNTSANSVVYTGSAVGTNSCATADQGSTACYTNGYNVWYKFVPPASGNYYVGVSAGTMSDPQVAVLSGTCGAFTTLGCAGWWTTTSQPYGYFGTDYSYTGACNLTAGTTYYIMVDDDWANGTFTVTATSLSNDQIQAAAMISNCGTSFNSSTIGATNCNNAAGDGYYTDIDNNPSTTYPGNCCGADVPSSMSIENESYYQFCVTSAATFSITVTPAAATCVGEYAGLSTTLQYVMYTGTSSSLTPVCANSGFGSASTCTISMSANQCAYILVDGYAGTNCDYAISINANPGCPLPIELLSFAGSLQAEGSVKLTWELAMESNIGSYVIERSADGITYTPLLQVPSAGNSNTKGTYFAIDVKPMAGANYYRLITVDNNGTRDAAAITLVTNNAGKQDFSLFPNPGSGRINIKASNFESSLIPLEIYDAFGTLAWRSELENKDGHIDQVIDLGQLAPGAYVVKIYDGPEIFRKKFVISR
jgi:hypothetical protein